MKKQKHMSWHTYFMSIALLSSFRSKDSKTQNGACIVDSHHKILSIGYNGLPRGCDDNDPQYWVDEDDDDPIRSKHTYVVHAEKNAIYNGMSHSMAGTKIYATQFPCNTCAQAIIQVGIIEVVYLRKKEHGIHINMNRAVNKMFKDAGVTVRCYEAIEAEDAVFLEELNSAGRLYD